MLLDEYIHGFRVLEKTHIEELSADAYTFFHEASGARLIAVLNDDDNKVFSIAFRTPPSSSNGLPHILEHSVLNGSRKYPTKEPFVELAKGSLNTFLNAMTYPDKTVYPVASRNQKDFMNLMDVYLDAVFFPRLYEDPLILMQEGWHYELPSADADTLGLRGVVYNEMKGAYSSPEAVLFQRIQTTLFPDTPYRYDSGGDPEVIPTLDQASFVDFHRTYYHPSNSYIFLYGDLDLPSILKKIDADYLAHFGAREIHADTPLQKPFSAPQTIAYPYALPEGVRADKKDYLSLNYVVGEADEAVTMLALEILQYVLIDSPAAPLKQKILEAGFAEDVFASLETSLRQGIFSIVAKGARKEDLEAFEALVTQELKRYQEEGIPRRLLEAALTRKEFELREADMRGYPKGLVVALNALTTWMHGEDPFLYVRFEPLLKHLKAGLENGLFESILKERLLDNKHAARVVLTAAPGLLEEKEREEDEALRNVLSSLSPQEREEIARQTELLRERQTTPDSPEALSTLPLLEREDIAPVGERIPTEDKTLDRARFLYHPIKTNNISYVNLYFPVGHLTEEELPYASALLYALGKIDTKTRPYSDLIDEINMRTGGLSFQLEAVAPVGETERYDLYVILRLKALTEKLPEAMALAKEIALTSRFDNTDHLFALFSEQRSRQEMGLYDRGHQVTAARLLAAFSPVDAVRDDLRGIGYFLFLKDFLRGLKEEPDRVRERLEQLYSKLFYQDHLIVSLTGEEAEENALRTLWEGWVGDFPTGRPHDARRPFIRRAPREALLAASKVQYVASGGHIGAIDAETFGTYQVLRTILSYDYLWNRVRVQGGAYGSMFQIERSGNFVFASYRDPHLKETLKTYRDVRAYLESFKADEREMTKYVIGTIARLDQPLTPSMKGERGDWLVLTGLTEERLHEERAAILRSDAASIRALAKTFAVLDDAPYVCVMGGRSRLEGEKELFDALTTLIEE
ncbi:MAG: Protein hypA [Candidatus Carbobacillus altaicus]|uniref:Protein hypA n=1 Tax=Candidatus Carbonibacillus altaicus TaxID=2163959 RepID=A0A2R6Y466_9BACL|nr:MAG: Protein hypA [Candidatus Carbobacillus altaicus]